MSNDVEVSVFVIAYNQEKYIRQCLDSLVMQQTNFNYEILIHDDASKDRTPEFIKDYEKKYTHIIKPIYQTENQYSQGKSINLEILRPLAKGKYIAFCEGDDYWTSEDKLQKQYDALEIYKNCSMAVHNVQKISEDGKPLTGKDSCYPFIDLPPGEVPAEITYKYVLEEGKYLFQTSCYFIRKADYDKLANEKKILDARRSALDFVVLIYCVLRGNLYYINEPMSAYRTLSEGSWTAATMLSDIKRAEAFESDIELAEVFDQVTNRKYTSMFNENKRRKQFYAYRSRGNIKEVRNPKYKDLYRKLTKKRQVYYFLANKMPFISKIIK